MIRASDVRAAYPNPISAHSFSYYQLGGGYCVGGAFLLFIGKELSWKPREIVEWLRRTNPNLGIEMATSLASKMIHLNDAKHFDEAWEVLDEALTYEVNTLANGTFPLLESSNSRRAA